MHIVIKHIVSNIGISLFLLFSILLGFNAYAEQSAEETIKARKALLMLVKVRDGNRFVAVEITD